ncbi:MAG: aminotransferase class V-fold PLP-dependent enzyme [Candidatus Zixiibacteriota bacterium]
MTQNPQPRRHAPLEMSPETFRNIGHQLVDQIALFLESLPNRKVTSDFAAADLRHRLPAGPLPVTGADPAKLIADAASLIIENSLFNGHPRFMGYITSSAAPIGALADLLASSVNPNVGAWVLSPIASEIEAQTVRWVSELIGYPHTAGGVLVSGGNMANFLGFVAARRAKVPYDIREKGLRHGQSQMLIYAAKSTHTWVQKAADLFGLGTDAIRWIPVTRHHQMDTDALRTQIQADLSAGLTPFLVVGTAGTVETGTVDPLGEISAICKEFKLWFHIDGAYGAPVGILPEAPADFKYLAEADSIAVDPHKWLYAPLEAGCTLVKNPQHLIDAFSFRPKYYVLDNHGDNDAMNYFEVGMQNSRGFRALKVWLALQQVGREGYVTMIREDIALAKQMFDLVAATPQLEAVTNSLSITTFRYVPENLKGSPEPIAKYLNELNEAVLNRLQKEGDLFLSNAIVDDRYLMRACIVNFRTSSADITAIPGIVLRAGASVDAEMRPASLR